jgi:hypothetical protein
MARTAKNRIEIPRSSPDNTAEVSPKVSEQEIATRAYELYQARGANDGSDLDDWLQAERELNRGGNE